MLVGAGDRGAHALGMPDDRLALGAELLDEIAHPHLVVAIAAFERADFGMNERFELGGAGDGALDAFVHRRDLAANRLADAHDAVGGGVLDVADGVGEPAAKGHLGHGAGGVAQFACAGDHDGEGEEDGDRKERGDQHAERAGQGGHLLRRADLPYGGRIEDVGGGQAQHDPDH